MKNSVTIKEVASKAGVSIATVSRVINGKDRVKKETRERVEEAIRQLNYQPDLIARTMIVKETKTVGLIVPQLSNEYWSLLSEIIQEELWSRGYTLILCSTGKKTEQEIAFLNMFMERRVDGIIYGSSSLSKQGDEVHLQKVIQSGIPIVSFDETIQGAMMVVGDHLQGAVEAVEHLIGLGHRDIAYIGGSAVSINRELGYHNVFIKHGLKVNEALIKNGADNNKNIQFAQFGYDAVKELLSSGAKFSAIFCGNDLIAFGAIKSLEESGIQVPDDVAIVGYDDINMAKMYKPALTTVRQPIRDIGRTAVELLLDSIKRGKAQNPPRKIVFQMQLVVRESCGANRRKNGFPVST